MSKIKDIVGLAADRPNRGEYIGQRWSEMDTHSEYVWNGAAWILVGRVEPLYAFKRNMESNGTDIPESAQDVGYPRWSLADAAVQRVKWQWAVPVGWDSMAIRFGWTNEAAAAAGVNWSFTYKLIYLGEGDVDAGAVTTVSLGTITAPAQFDFKYESPSQIAEVLTPSGAIFGEKPFMQCTLVRDGVADAHAGAVSVALATGTRMS